MTICNGLGKTTLHCRSSLSERFNTLNIGQPRPLPSAELPCGSPHRATHHVACLNLNISAAPYGRAGIYAAQVRPADRGEFPQSATHHDGCLKCETPFLCLAKEAARRLPFIKKAASTLCDLIRECPLIGDGSVQAHRVVHDIIQEMLELEEALGQLHANSTRQTGFSLW